METHRKRRKFIILVVEDNPDDIVFIQEALGESGFDIDLNIVRDGNEAYSWLTETDNDPVRNLPDLIFLDLNLPRKSGLEFLAEIRNEDRFRLLPVVVLTTSKAEDDIRKSYTHYANSYIVKPIDLNEFIMLIKQVTAFWFDIAVLPGARI